MSNIPFEPGHIFPGDLSEAHCFVIQRDKFLTRHTDRARWAPLTMMEVDSFDLDITSIYYLGAFEGQHCVAYEIAADESELGTVSDLSGTVSGEPGWGNNQEASLMRNGVAFKDLRSLLFSIDPEMFALASRAKETVAWDKQHRYCGACGELTQPHAEDRAKECKACKLLFYPRSSPCIITLVTKGEEILLARSPNFTEGVYSTLAGFIESGESVERAMHREIFEEVGVKVKNLRYFRSQPWPFPHQLMLGFFAEYDSGDIVIDNKEIVDAKWWHYKDLPLTPPNFAISGQLIEQYIRELEGRL